MYYWFLSAVNTSEVGKNCYWTFNTSQMRGLLIRDQFWKGHLAWFILQSPQGSSQLNSAGERNLWPSEQAYGHCLYLTKRGTKRFKLGKSAEEKQSLENISYTQTTLLQKSMTQENLHIIYEISVEWWLLYVVMYFLLCGLSKELTENLF